MSLSNCRPVHHFGIYQRAYIEYSNVHRVFIRPLSNLLNSFVYMAEKEKERKEGIPVVFCVKAKPSLSINYFHCVGIMESGD